MKSVAAGPSRSDFSMPAPADSSWVIEASEGNSRRANAIDWHTSARSPIKWPHSGKIYRSPEVTRPRDPSWPREKLLSMPSLVPFSDLLGAIFEPFKATRTFRVGLPTRSLISLKHMFGTIYWKISRLGTKLAHDRSECCQVGSNWLVDNGLDLLTKEASRLYLQQMGKRNLVHL